MCNVIHLGLKMRIRELLENKEFNDLDYIRRDGDKSELDYDLVEDLVHFLNNDDHVYRRFVYPALAKCLEDIKNKKKVSPGIFKIAAQEGYKSYVQKFPVNLLSDDLEEEVCTKVCKKMHEDLYKHVEEGKYKD